MWTEKVLQCDSMLRLFSKSEAAKPQEPAPLTEEQRLAEAERAYRAADDEFAQACSNCTAVNRQRLQMESLRERAREKRNESLRVWSELKRGVHGEN
jgi:hypothetical protein